MIYKADRDIMQHVTTGADAQKNFLIVDGKTETSAIESAFDKFTQRKDIGIILINQHVSCLSHAWALLYLPGSCFG
jgi:hypothetical protein